MIGRRSGAGATIATFRFIVRSRSRKIRRAWQGARSRASPDRSSNNAASAGAWCRCSRSGYSNTTAVMLGARSCWPAAGPGNATTNASLVWAVIASMYIGNVILLVMNRSPACSPACRRSASWIYPPILAICLTGVISHANNVEDAWLMLAFGVIGWLMKRYDPAAPWCWLVLGPLFEYTLRQSLTLSRRGLIFLSRRLPGIAPVALLAVFAPPDRLEPPALRRA